MNHLLSSENQEIFNKIKKISKELEILKRLGINNIFYEALKRGRFSKYSYEKAMKTFYEETKLSRAFRIVNEYISWELSYKKIDYHPYTFDLNEEKYKKEHEKKLKCNLLEIIELNDKGLKKERIFIYDNIIRSIKISLKRGVDNEIFNHLITQQFIFITKECYNALIKFSKSEKKSLLNNHPFLEYETKTQVNKITYFQKFTCLENNFDFAKFFLLLEALKQADDFIISFVDSYKLIIEIKFQSLVINLIKKYFEIDNFQIYLDSWKNDIIDNMRKNIYCFIIEKKNSLGEMELLGGVYNKEMMNNDFLLELLSRYFPFNSISNPNIISSFNKNSFLQDNYGLFLNKLSIYLSINTPEDNQFYINILRRESFKTFMKMIVYSKKNINSFKKIYSGIENIKSVCEYNDNRARSLMFSIFFKNENFMNDFKKYIKEDKEKKYINEAVKELEKIKKLEHKEINSNLNDIDISPVLCFFSLIANCFFLIS